MTPSSTSGSDHLRVDGISKAFAGRRVLTDISFTVTAREPAALIGENGTGKSTLLRIIAGLDDADSGVTDAPGAQLYHQQPPFPTSWRGDEVLADATAPTRAAIAEVTAAGEALAAHPDDAAASARLEHALAEADRIDAWQLDHHVALLRDGLGLTAVPTDRPMSELSGGQQARYSLAWVLLRHPQVLLLDEPTNHLDDRGAQVLTEILRGWSGPVLLASHDRAFLDDAAHVLIDLDPHPTAHATVAGEGGAVGPGAARGVTRFTGRYSDYVQHRADEHLRWQEQYSVEQAELKRLRGRVKSDQSVGHENWTPRSETRMAQKFYSDRNATVVSRRVNDARSSLEQLEAEQVRKPPATLHFRGLDAAAVSRAPQASGILLTARDISVTGRVHPTSLTIPATGRLLVEGPNGCGKSTLLRLLAGDLQADEGVVTRAPRLRVGLLGQDTTAAPEVSALEHYRSQVGDAVAESVPLSTFGLLSGRDAARPVTDLSVGQRRRLDLAILLAAPPDLLLLDEPTNHFSLLLSEQIEASLPAYPGAVVVASHDRLLRRRWPGERLTLTSASEDSAKH